MLIETGKNEREVFRPACLQLDRVFTYRVLMRTTSLAVRKRTSRTKGNALTIVQKKWHAREQRLVLMAHPMRDWMDERDQEGKYFDTTPFRFHWSDFREPTPCVQAYRRPLSDKLNTLPGGGWLLDQWVEPLPRME